MNETVTSEPELLTRLSHGDEQAYTQIYENYHGRIRWFVSTLTCGYRYDPQDIAQDVFMALWEKRMLMPEARNFEAYLFTMARNTVFNSEKQYQLRRKIIEYYKTGDWYEEPRYNLMKDYLPDQSVRAIEALPRKCGEAFRMYIYYGLSYKEIAAKLAITTQAVSKHIRKAKEEINTLLEQKGAAVFAWIMLLVILAAIIYTQTIYI